MPKKPQNSPDAFPWERPDSFPHFGAALRARRENLHLTLDQVAALTKISKPYLSNIETARAPGPPSEEKLRLIAKALQLPAQQLLSGADWLRAPPSMRRALLAAAGSAGDPAVPRRADGALDLDAIVSKSPSRGATSPVFADPAALPVRFVPLINRVQAGAAAEFTDLNYPAGVADAYVPAPDLPGAPAATAFALRIQGDSMQPEYQDGDIVIVTPDHPPRDGDDCVVRLGELEHFATTFKRIYFIPSDVDRDADAQPDSVRLVPLNSEFSERTVSLEQVTGIYPLLYRMIPPNTARPARLPAAPAPVEDRAPSSFTSRVSIEHD